MATKWRQVMVAIDRIVWTKQKIPHRRSIKKTGQSNSHNLSPLSHPTKIMSIYHISKQFLEQFKQGPKKGEVTQLLIRRPQRVLWLNISLTSFFIVASFFVSATSTNDLVSSQLKKISSLGHFMVMRDYKYNPRGNEIEICSRVLMNTHGFRLQKLKTLKVRLCCASRAHSRPRNQILLGYLD